MKIDKRIQNCKLCGERKKLTFEHVPPQKAFNDIPVKNYSLEDSIKIMTGANGRMPWDFNGLRGAINQKGNGDYFLCQECNNNTGSWYINDYVSFAKTFNAFIQKENPEINKAYSIGLYDIYPLRIYKAILTMFCDINYNCFGDEGLRKLLLDKESNKHPNKNISIYLYLVTPNMRRIFPVSVLHQIGIGSLTLSEISSYPIGLSLYIDKPEEVIVPGICLDDFLNYGYNDMTNILFKNIPYFDINTNIPIDFRSKAEIEMCIKENTEIMYKESKEN